jgi:hypothetical protein
MSTNSDTITPQQLLQLAQTLSPAEMRWLRAALDKVAPPGGLKPDARVALEATFGMWAGRDDLPVDGVAYVDQLRHSTRWDDLERLPDETD